MSNPNGARLEVSLETFEIDAAAMRLSDRHQLLDMLASSVTESSKERFETKTDPQGQPWAAWSSAYAATVKNPNHSLLFKSGALKASIANEIFGHDVAVIGTKQHYAKQHQYGAGMLPARPFIGLSEEDKKKLKELSANWVKERVR